MSNLSPSARAPAPQASPLDHQGGLSLWLRAGIFALALLAAVRPDRWVWSLPTLHDVLLWLFAYSIVGDFVLGVLGIMVAVVIFVAVIMLLCFDRGVYVPAFRLARGRFQLSALAAFSVAVLIEGAVTVGLILGVRHHVRPPGVAAPASHVVVHHPRQRNIIRTDPVSLSLCRATRTNIAKR
jgi:hypothetical protein